MSYFEKWLKAQYVLRNPDKFRGLIRAKQMEDDRIKEKINEMDKYSRMRERIDANAKEVRKYLNEQKNGKMNEMAKNEHKEAITDQTMMRWVIIAEGAPVDSIYLDMAAHEIGPILVVLRAFGLKPKVCQP